MTLYEELIARLIAVERKLDTLTTMVAHIVMLMEQHKC